MCEELSDFLSVTSLFRLDNNTAQLLLRAKDQNDAVSRWILESLVKVALHRRMKEIITSQKVSHIVISPIRKERVMNGGWHPAHLIEQVCKSFPQRVIVPTIDGVERQASFSAKERLVRQQNPRLIYPQKRSLDGECVDGVLFVDDVLTTGGSAQRARKVLPHTFIFADWHILTLFRAPLSCCSTP